MTPNPWQDLVNVIMRIVEAHGVDAAVTALRNTGGGDRKNSDLRGADTAWVNDARSRRF
jgi:hypothetical protein